MALMGIDWITGLALLLGGGVVGVLVGRLFAGDSGREKRLVQELEQTQQELKTYKDNVETHFRETAKAVNEMTDSYRRVHEKLRAGAEALCSDSGPLLELRSSPRIEQSTAAAAGGVAASPGKTPPATEAPVEVSEEESAPPASTAAVAGENSHEPEPNPADSETEAGQTAAGSEEKTAAADADESATDAEDAAAELAETTEETAATQPLDYAVDSDAEDRDKTIH